MYHALNPHKTALFRTNDLWKDDAPTIYACAPALLLRAWKPVFMKLSDDRRLTDLQYFGNGASESTRTRAYLDDDVVARYAAVRNDCVEKVRIGDKVLTQSLVEAKVYAAYYVFYAVIFHLFPFKSAYVPIGLTHTTIVPKIKRQITSDEQSKYKR